MKLINKIVFSLIIIISMAVTELQPQSIKSSMIFSDFLISVKNSAAGEKQKLVDEFIVKVKEEGYPIFENDSTVVLLYNGNRDTVEIIGDMTDWAFIIPMQHIEGTDLYYYRGHYEPDARLEYWLQFSKQEFPSTDTLNKFKSLNGFGEISELAMPRYQRHPIFNDYLYGRKGGYEEVTEVVLPAGVLDYEHTIHVYLPEGYDAQQEYPVVYFQDGKDYIEFAVVPHILNELIKAGSIKPLIAVFVTPPNLHQPKLPNRMTEYGMNDEYVKFFTKELVGYIDSNYSTIKDPASRLVVGDSYGGLISTYIALSNPGVFKNAYSQSGYHSFSKDKIIKLVDSTEKKPVSIYLDIGTYEKKVGASFLPADETDFTEGNRRFKRTLELKRYSFVYKEYPEGHTWGNWRRHLIDALVYFFGKE